MPPRVWQCGPSGMKLDVPVVMGIVNVTPDSFSDGGRFAEAEAAIAHGRDLIAEGARIVDVGGESTRPGAEPVTLEEEIERVRPVLAALSAEGACTSIDTRHAPVAAAAVEAGASILNDVSGFRDQAMVDVAASCEAGVVIMHMQGEPATMQEAPHYDDVVAEVRAWLERQARLLRDAGVARSRIAVDPGIGFGKTLDHNLELLRCLDDLASLGYPVVVGVSRKRFIGALTGVELPSERLPGSLAAAVWAYVNGADVLRVHDVAPTVQSLAVAAALRRGASGSAAS